VANQEQLEILRQGVDVWNKWAKDNFIGFDLKGANLRESNLEKAHLPEADLRGADLWKANLREAYLPGAMLDGANLEEAFLNKAILRSVTFYKADSSKADLSHADLMDARLSEADFKGAKLFEANLTRAQLFETNLTRANLTGANLSGARLSEAILRNACLWDTNFRDAYLEYVVFCEVDLRDADLTGSQMGGTVLVNCDLRESIGLATVIHKYPSIINIKTIQKSNGNIPEEFLRGFGLSDLEIEQAKLATPGLDPEQVTDITYKIHELYLGDGIQYYSCFISYSSNDHEFAKRLHDDLQNSGVRCWFDREDMKIGDQIRPRIDQEIRLRDKLLVILSENSVNSEWVGDEVEAALEEEKESGRLVLFPIRLDEAVMETRDDWAAKIKRRRHIGDFSNWKDEGSYQKVFERLLRDLKASPNTEFQE
jgi:uncharacterized protein YjbI with pentapeptide repeats